MGCKMILLCVITLIIMARLCTARSSLATKRRGSNKKQYGMATYLNARGNCDERAPPTYNRSGQLYCKLGFLLTVIYNGTLHGVNYTYCQQTNRCRFQLQSCGTSIIRIKHEQSGLYVAINKVGKVYTTPRNHKLSTLFKQNMISTGWTLFQSERGYRKGKNMYLALKKNGAIKNSKRPSHKSTHFMVLKETKPYKRTAT